ncbi:MAG: hypothetical protein HZB99_02355 [Candidatus Harrisonbacteria bacterium]|nr:hypothetical protein [Candidatus Harrisonbacteria bacterium]
MKFFITYLFLVPISAFAHELGEAEEEITNLAEAELAGPITALLIIVFTIIISRRMRHKRSMNIKN